MQNQDPARTPWSIILSAFFLAFATWIPLFCVPPMEHIIKEALGLTHAQTSLVYTGPILMIVLFAIPAGLIGDRIGMKKAAGIGAVAAALGAVLRGTADSYPALLGFTLIYGFGLAWTFPNLPKLVSAWTPREKAGLTTGIFTSGLVSGGAVALAATMPLIFPITHTFQGVFLVWSILPAIAAIVWWLVVKEPPYQRNHTGSPFLEILRNKNLWLVAGLMLLSNFFMYTWGGWMPLLLSQKGASESIAGLITSVGMWAGIPTVLLMPHLSFRLGLRKPFLWVPGIVIAIGAVAVIYASIPANLALQFVVGMVASTRFAHAMALPVELMPREQVGAASGLVLAIGYIGAILGPLMGGSILDFTGSLQLSFFILTGAGLLSALVAALIPETGSRARS